MPMYADTTKIERMYVGTDEVKKIYVGTDLVFENAVVTPFDGYYKDRISVKNTHLVYNGIEWTGAYLTMPNYSGAARWDYVDVTTEGTDYTVLRSYMTTHSDANNYYNSHVCTYNPVIIPSNATELNVALNLYDADNCTLEFGLVHKDSLNSYAATSATGYNKDPDDPSIMTSYEVLYPSGHTGHNAPSDGAPITRTIQIPSSLRGTRYLYRIVINSRKIGTSDSGFKIYKVWFTIDNT